MKVSLSGLLKRLKGRSDQIFIVNEFIKHYQIAKLAFNSGDQEVVKQFFSLYVTEQD